MSIHRTELQNASWAWQGHGGYSEVGRIWEAEALADRDISKAKHQNLSVNVSLPLDISDLVALPSNTLIHPTAFSYVTVSKNGCFQLKALALYHPELTNQNYVLLGTLSLLLMMMLL